MTTAVSAVVLMGPAAAPARGQEEFTITGEISELYPNAETTLDARVANPQPFPIRVTSLTVTARDASPGCSASMLEIGSARRAVDIAPGATGTVPIVVRMGGGAPDACKGVTWPLAFTGTATEVGVTTGPPAESPARPGAASAPTAESRSGPRPGATIAPTAPTATGPAGWAHTGANLALLVAIGASLVAAGRLARHHTRRR